MAARMRVELTRWPSSSVFATPTITRPRSVRCACAKATSPARLLPKRKLAPTTMARAPIRPISTSSRNCAGVSEAIDASKGST